MSGRALTHWEGEPLHLWEAAWSVPRLEAWDILGSTNERARTLVGESARAFTTVVAEEQSSGRGREGRAWWSPAGGGLWMSVVVRPGPVDARLLAPVLAGLAVCRALEPFVTGRRIGLKWPNDIVIDDRKVCGILCEGIGDAVVVGIGVNVEQEADDFPETLRADAISLGMAAGRAVPRGQLAGRILHELQTVLSHPTFRLEGPLFEAVRRRDVLREVSVEVTGGPEGVARGIDATGALLVDTGDGRPVRVVAGSVRRSGRTPGRESSA